MMMSRRLTDAAFFWSLLVPLTLLAQSARPSLPKDWATVTGRVLDQDGRPVVGARIKVFPLDVAIGGPVPEPPLTDSEGRYHLSTPAYQGRTRLCAIKESAGYPDTNGLLFSSVDDNMPEVSLTPGAMLETINIRLGPPDGVVEVAVLDLTTGKPVSKARLVLRRTEPSAFYSATIPEEGHVTLALPNVPIYVSVQAPGYLQWVYKDDSTGKPYLLLPRGSSKVLSVNLVAQEHLAP